jgi:hypothetical protein
LATIHNFQKYKIPRLDRLPVEFYSSFFDFLGVDLLRVVEYSRTSSQILAAFNTSFTMLIPKSDNLSSF